MDAKIESLFELAGNSNRYQYLLAFLTFLLWINLNILGVSLGLMEKAPEVEYYDAYRQENVTSSLNSTICDWKDNYTITKNYSHSVVTTFNYDCNPVWIGLLGTATFSGNLIGCFLFQYLIEKLGRKKTVIANSVPFLISLSMIIFTPNYVILVVLFFLCEIFTVNIAFSTYLLSCEIASSTSRSTFGAFINSAFGICGVLYTIYCKYVGDWRHVFAICLGSNVGFIIAFILLSHESPRFYLVKKDFLKFIESLRNIARANNRLEIFNEKIQEEDCLYNEAYEFLRERIGKKITEQPNISNVKYIPFRGESSEESANTDIVINNQFTNKNEIKTNSNVNKIENIEETYFQKKLKNVDFEEKNCSVNNKSDNLKKVKGFSISDFFRYASIRYKFLSLCFIWLTSSGSYYGLSINIKNLDGDLYFNGIVNYGAEIIIYIVAGYLINIKLFGRKNTMLIFYAVANIGLIFYIFFSFNESVTNLLLFIVRLCLAANYIIIFTYTLEIYPSPARARGFGINTAVSKLTPVIFPILIEIFPKIIFYIYLLMNLICFVILIVVIPETLGKPLKENIDEEDINNSDNKKLYKSGSEDIQKPLIDPLSSF